MLLHRAVFLAALFTVVPSLSLGQQTSPPPNPAQPEDKRIFWIIPNYRTSPSLHPYKPLTPEEKFKIAAEDSFAAAPLLLPYCSRVRLS
jgi:hypothetical protein